MTENLKSKILNLLNIKLVRFFLVSGLNTIFGYGLFALLLFVGLQYPYALLATTIAGIIFNFKTIGALVFDNRNNFLFFKFIGVYLVTYLCSLSILTLFDQFKVSLYLGGAILIIPMGLFAFFLNKKFVFNHKSHSLVSKL
ncbi:MAG: GtrA family protein [Bacteroidales bacterium]|nr:GtrA family protein [Bacteroidales bacterium]